MTSDLTGDMARVADGDLKALRRVYDATAPRTLGICLRILGDRDTAEDALQETYLRLWRRAARFDPARASVATWLGLIARSTAIDAARATGRYREHLDDFASHADPQSHQTIDAGALHDCLDRLGEDQSGAIRAAFFDGYSYPQLATQADVPLPTMKSRVRRGLLALRSCLQDD